MNHILTSKRGSTIFPVLIVATLISIMLASMFGLLFPLLRGQVAAAGKGQIKDALENLRMCAFDGYAWSKTLSKNSRMQCLLGASGCSPNSDFGQIQIVKPDGTACIDDYNSLKAGAGLTENGVACDGFEPVKGNDACPYRIEANWYVSCDVGTNSCLNPAQTIVFDILFRPFNQNKIALNLGDGVSRTNFKSKQTSAITLFTGTRSNALQAFYTDLHLKIEQSRDILRGQVVQQTNRNPLVIWELTGAGITGGKCSALPAKTRRLNFVENDPALMVTDAIVKGSIPLRKGDYECSISAPGFAVGKFSAALVQTSPATKAVLVQGSNALASTTMSFAQVRSMGSGHFQLAQDSIVQLQQTCREIAVAPPKDPLLTNSMLTGAMGLPFGRDFEIYSVLDCTVADLK